MKIKTKHVLLLFREGKDHIFLPTKFSSSSELIIKNLFFPAIKQGKQGHD